MKRILYLFTVVILVCLLSLSGCSPLQSESDEKPIYQTISSENAKKRLDSEKGIILLDVRSEAEYAEKHIPGSLLIPVEAIETQAAEKLKDKDATIFVYCRSGNRSVIAAQALANMNYTDVYNLGGINSWPYATEATPLSTHSAEVTLTSEPQKAEPEEEVKSVEQTNRDEMQPSPKKATESPSPVSAPEPTPKQTPAPAPLPTPEPNPQINAEKQKMLDLINAERAKIGAAPLSADIKVMEVAQVKSGDMVKNNYFSHDSPSYGSPFDMLKKFGVTFQGAAENIALNSSIEAAHAALMKSEGHRINILNPSYIYIGIGISDSPKGKVVAQMFVKK
ncbi:rhodanese-like domain-containing protein [Desulfosporosinus youngiae]|uniref:Uncharacterized protein with SCP/PR1 domains n=1 Tax=Desulfosporosinus youngiae DSM 17734 TaxID=768710 RepID=H5Y2R9_9FIRM|nr:rhodanese-like domain-containing protein [Desulfosporosinus youngiae]EHQ88332.1 uncharacterized protein with SCP/PR1 domains [Desulfosporosinus youngiae DSM 17734]